MGCHSFSPGYLPDPGIERRSPALQADSLLSEQQGKPIIVEVAIVAANWVLTKDGPGAVGLPAWLTDSS